MTLRAPKYGNIKTRVGGLDFDSKKEAKRYEELLLLQRAGEISSLETQVWYDLKVNGVKICAYVADLVYIDNKTGEKVVEDVKSPFTRKLPVYRLKARLMKACHGIDVREVA